MIKVPMDKQVNKIQPVPNKNNSLGEDCRFQRSAIHFKKDEGHRKKDDVHHLLLP